MDSDAGRLGRYGSIWCKDTLTYSAPTGTLFCAFFFTEASVFTSLGCWHGSGTIVASPGSVAASWKSTVASASTVLASFTFPAGSTIYGMWTTWQLASGGVIAYKVASPDYAHG